jgi:AraC family transcriptional regulator of adaptative response/methylated-DNA-[protein]-cysteine methyltransferase
LGMTPATYSRRGRKMKIDYAIAESTLGFVLVAATTRGLCSVRLGDAESILEGDLRKEYEAAEIQQNNGLLAEALKQILNNLTGKQPHLDLPLDIQATAFQRQVWTALRAIPYGSTRSYSDVAKTIGRPRSVRAVARACATNPVALVIPCHRVVREDGGLGGYRWGMDRKRRLLDTEVVHRDRKTSAK